MYSTLDPSRAHTRTPKTADHPYFPVTTLHTVRIAWESYVSMYCSRGSMESVQWKYAPWRGKGSKGESRSSFFLECSTMTFLGSECSPELAYI